MSFVSFLLLAQLPAADLEFFEKKIRPALAEHCYSCHSTKAKKVKGGLLLDSRAGLLKGGETGTAFDSKSPANSLFLKAISYKDVNLEMPPRGKLPEAVLKDFETWILSGAVWPEENVGAKSPRKEKDGFDLARRKSEHWCWQPLAKRPADGDVDAMIAAALRVKGLPQNGPANAETLIRRMYFDVVGLPPSPKEIDAFLAAEKIDRAKAVREVVDRLLASPQFGERWARHWLDLVRYAESRGHEFDYNAPNVYQYRDYVIRALNQDVPYDLFVKEHLAGDLLRKPRLHPEAKFNESILGTGMWFLGEQVHSPVDICQDRADRMDNNLDVMTKTFLGLTVACARCHDHKFDAISTKDYYALAGYLESSSYRLVPFESLEQNRVVAEKLAKLRDEYQVKFHQAFVAAALPLADKLLDDPKFLQHPSRVITFPAPVRHLVDYSEGNFKPEEWSADGFAFGQRPIRRGEVLLGTGSLKFSGLARYSFVSFDTFWDGLKVGPDSESESGALGKVVSAGKMLRTPKFDIGADKIYVLMRGSAHLYASVEGHVMIAGPLHGRLNQQLKAGNDFEWVPVDLAVYQGRRAHFEFTPTSADFGIQMIVESPKPPRRENGFVVFDKKESVALIQKWKDTRPLESHHDATLAFALLPHVEKDPTLVKLSESYAEKVEDLKKEVRWQSRLAPAFLDGNGVNEKVFIRGSHKTPGEVVPRRYLEAFDGHRYDNKPATSGRLELAETMVDPERNPLISRVIVNRLWHHLFGKGIVPSVDNFGVLGEQPSHPELLDFLARKFVDDGWSIKAMLRHLMLSKTYQMSSLSDPKAEAIDPGNRLVHRQNLRRLEGEAIRDAMLAVSGRLDLKMYGPPVPVFLNDFQQGRGRPGSGPRDGNGRRSVYLSVRRNFLPAMLLAFDSPIPFSTVGRRTTSNVPAQALILLNDQFVHDQGALWAKRMLAEKVSNEERLTRMYRMALGRVPSEDDLRACLEYLKAKNNDAAAWADVGHVLFNTKEFIYLP